MRQVPSREVLAQGDAVTIFLASNRRNAGAMFAAVPRACDYHRSSSAENVTPWATAVVVMPTMRVRKESDQGLDQDGTSRSQS